MAFGLWADLIKAAAFRLGEQPAMTCRFKFDGRDFLSVCPLAFAACTGCRFLPDRSFRPFFCVLCDFFTPVWAATVQGFCKPCCLAPACWYDATDRSRNSSSVVVQDICDVYSGCTECVPERVIAGLGMLLIGVVLMMPGMFGVGLPKMHCLMRVELLRGLSNFPLISIFGVALLYLTCVGLVASVWGGFTAAVARMAWTLPALSIFSTLHVSGYFQRRIRSAEDVHTAIWSQGFSDARWDALHQRWWCCFWAKPHWSYLFISALG